jgi:cbb3-type cytochrome oxidase subunit 3
VSLKAELMTRAGSSNSWVPLTILLLFFGLFIVVIFWIMKKDRKPYYDKVENIPLEDLKPEGEIHE